MRWSVSRRGRPVLLPSTIGLELEGRPALGREPRLRRVGRASSALRLSVPFPVRRRTVVDRHHELSIELRDGLSLAFRAWDDAVAYRLSTALDGEVRVRGEEAGFRFPEGSVGWLPIADCSRRKGQDCFHTSFEEVYTVLPLRELGGERRAFLPVLVAVPGGPKMVLTESDLDDYPGMWVTEGRWEVEAYEDGPNAARYGADWRRQTREVTAADRLTIRMAPGGGWVARFRRKT